MKSRARSCRHDLQIMWSLRGVAHWNGCFATNFGMPFHLILDKPRTQLELECFAPRAHTSQSTSLRNPQNVRPPLRQTRLPGSPSQPPVNLPPMRHNSDIHCVPLIINQIRHPVIPDPNPPQPASSRQFHRPRRPWITRQSHRLFNDACLHRSRQLIQRLVRAGFETHGVHHVHSPSRFRTASSDTDGSRSRLLDSAMSPLS